MGAEEEVAERGGQETVPGVLPVPVPQNPKGHNHPLLARMVQRDTEKKRDLKAWARLATQEFLYSAPELTSFTCSCGVYF